MTDPDGVLRPALVGLADAIALLIDPHLEIVDGHRLCVPSWYDQLVAASPQRGGGTPGKPVTECWLDKLMLLTEIDDGVARWQPDGRDTPHRLVAIQGRPWRPQDCRQIGDLTQILADWVADIRGLIVREARLSLPDPCPECGQKTGHHVDSAGERVRGAALQVSVAGAECTACRAKWPPDQLTFLGRLLRYEPPAGVCE